MEFLDGTAWSLVLAALAPATRAAYRLALERWEKFCVSVGLGEAALLVESAREREQWAIRYQVWLMWVGTPAAGAAQLVYNTSAALWAKGAGSLLELGTARGKLSRVGKVKRGALGGAAVGWVRAGDRQGMTPRPLTDWELRVVCRWWREEACDEAGVGRRWAAILTVAYYACWRPSQYTRSTRASIPWRRWLVRMRDVVVTEGYIQWRVRTQKTGNSFLQRFYRGGPAEDLVEAMEELMQGADKMGKGVRWLCWLYRPDEPVGYADLLARWALGVQAAGLEGGVEGAYAMRRGGATFWCRAGLSWRQVGAANGWVSAVVRRYILRKLWRECPPTLAPAAALQLQSNSGMIVEV